MGGANDDARYQAVDIRGMSAAGLRTVYSDMRDRGHSIFDPSISSLTATSIGNDDKISGGRSMPKLRVSAEAYLSLVHDGLAQTFGLREAGVIEPAFSLVTQPRR
jgi:hypothetical protein